MPYSASDSDNMMQVISYLSRDSSNNSRQLEQLEQFFEAHPWVRFVQFRWIDFCGLLRVRMLAKKYCLELVRDNKTYHSARYALDACIDNSWCPPGLDALGSSGYHPDWSTLRAFPSADHPGSQYAYVMCAISAHSQDPVEGEILDICPRRALTNALAKVKEILDVGLLVGFEVEFTLLTGDAKNGFWPYSTSRGYNVYGSLRSKAFKVIDEIVEQMQALGVEVQTFHTEGSKRNQFEITLAPLPPMEAVDQLVIVQSTIKDVASRHGCQATMSPKPVKTQSTNGLHTHISLNPPKHEEEFLAGILGRLAGICSICLPYEVSWQRLHGPFQAGSTVTWGTQNKLATLRKIKPGYWEIRCVDAMSNMYLTLAAIISAGLLGVQNKETLRWKDTSLLRKDGVRMTPYTLDLSNEEKLPQGLDDALDALEGFVEELQQMANTKAFEHHIKIKRNDKKLLNSMTIAELNNMLIELF